MTRTLVGGSVSGCAAAAREAATLACSARKTLAVKPAGRIPCRLSVRLSNAGAGSAAPQAAGLVRTSRHSAVTGLQATPGVPRGSSVPDALPREGSQSSEDEQERPGTQSGQMGPPQSTSASPTSSTPLRQDGGSADDGDGVADVVALPVAEGVPEGVGVTA